MSTHAQAQTARVLKIVAKSLAVALGLLIFFGAALWGFAMTRPGGRLLLKVSTSAVNRQIRGHLAIGELAFRGHAIELRDVALDDPEGHRVVSLSRLFVSYQLGPLLEHRVHVTSLAIQHPVVQLRRDERGLNLAHALAARHPKPPEASKPPQPSAHPWDVDVDNVVLDSGQVSAAFMRAITPPLRIAISRLNVVSSASLDTAGHHLKADLVTEAVLEGPDNEARPLAVRVKVARQAPGSDANAPGTGAGTGDLRLGKAVALHFDLTGANEGALQIDGIHFPPTLMNALFPGWPVVVAIDTTGSLRFAGGVLATALRISGEGTHGALTFAGDIAMERADNGQAGQAGATPHGLTLQAHDLRLSEWLRGLPAISPLALQVRVEAGSLEPDALTGRIRADVPKMVLRRQAYGPFHLEVDASRGDLERLVLSLPLPGMLVSGQGGTKDHAATVNLQVNIRELSQVRRAWLAWQALKGASAAGAPPAPLPALSGKGALSLTASAARSRLWRDATLEGRLALRMPTLQLGETVLRDLSVEVIAPKLERTRQEIALKLGLRRPFDVQLSAATESVQTRAARDQRPGPEMVTTLVTLRELELAYQGAHWKNEGTAQLQTGGALSLRNFRLQSEAQRLALDAERTGERWDAHLRLQKWDLARLPLPPTTGALAGVLDADVRLSGAAANPHLEAQATLEKGRFEDERQRAMGDLEAQLQFDGPMDRPRAALTLEGKHLVVRPLHLSESDVLAAGVSRLSYPRVRARLSYAPPTVSAAATLVDAGGGTVKLEGSTRLKPAELSHLTPTVKARLQQRGLRGSLTLTHCDPAGLALFVPALRKVEGRVTAAFRLAGTVQNPLLAGHLSWKDGALVTAPADQPAEPPRDRGSDP